MTRVESDHRHLVEPLQDLLALRLRDAVNVWKPELVYHIRSDCLVTPLQGLVEELDQLAGILGNDVLRLRVQRVRDGNRDGHVLAFEGKVAGRAGSLALVLVRLKVVDNRVGVRFRFPLWATGGCPRGGLFVFPLLNHRVTRVTRKLGSLQSEIVGILPAHGLALAVPSGYHIPLFGLLLYKPLSLVGVALLATMPEATVELEDGFCLGVITIHPSAQKVPLTPMATTSVVNVNAPLLGFPLEPFCSDEAATVLGIKGFLVSRWGVLDAFVRVDGLGLPEAAMACCVTNQVARFCEAGLTIPAGKVAGNLLDVADQESVTLIETHG